MAVILKEELKFAGVEVRKETPGLVPNSNARPGDIYVPDFEGPGTHLCIDFVVASPFCDNNLRSSIVTPGGLTRAAEDGKFQQDQARRATSAARGRGRGRQPDYTFVPFAIDTGGRLGAQACTLLTVLAKTLAERSGTAKDTPEDGLNFARTRWIQLLSGIVHAQQASYLLQSATV